MSTTSSAPEAAAAAMRGCSRAKLAARSFHTMSCWMAAILTPVIVRGAGPPSPRVARASPGSAPGAPPAPRRGGRRSRRGGRRRTAASSPPGRRRTASAPRPRSMLGRRVMRTPASCSRSSTTPRGRAGRAGARRPRAAGRAGIVAAGRSCGRSRGAARRRAGAGRRPTPRRALALGQQLVRDLGGGSPWSGPWMTASPATNAWYGAAPTSSRRPARPACSWPARGRRAAPAPGRRRRPAPRRRRRLQRRPGARRAVPTPAPCGSPRTVGATPSRRGPRPAGRRPGGGRRARWRRRPSPAGRAGRRRPGDRRASARVGGRPVRPATARRPAVSPVHSSSATCSNEHVAGELGDVVAAVAHAVLVERRHRGDDLHVERRPRRDGGSRRRGRRGARGRRPSTATCRPSTATRRSIRPRLT